MASNLPPGLSESQIPGCTPEDHDIDAAIDAKQCEACRFYETEEHCDDCYTVSGLSKWEVETDEALILERLRASAEAREDGHIDG